MRRDHFDAAAINEIMMMGGRIHRHSTGEWAKPGEPKPFTLSVRDADVERLIKSVDLLVMQRDSRGRPVAAKLNDNKYGVTKHQGATNGA
jgi:hypothetical protein